MFKKLVLGEGKNIVNTCFNLFSIPFFEKNLLLKL